MDVLTVEQSAARLGVAPDEVLALIADDVLEPVGYRGGPLLRAETVDAVAEIRRAAAGAGAEEQQRPAPELWTFDDAASYFHTTATQVRHWVDSGWLGPVVVGADGVERFRPDDVLAVLERASRARR